MTAIVVAQFQIDGGEIYMLDTSGVIYHGKVADGTFSPLQTDIDDDSTTP